MLLLPSLTVAAVSAGCMMSKKHNLRGAGKLWSCMSRPKLRLGLYPYLGAIASNLEAMVSNLIKSNGLQPISFGSKLRLGLYEDILGPLTKFYTTQLPLGDFVFTNAGGTCTWGCRRADHGLTFGSGKAHTSWCRSDSALSVTLAAEI